MHAYDLARPLLFSLDPEQAHDLTLQALAGLQRTPASALWARRRVADPLLLAGLRFPNRIGLAAGLDKNGACIDGLGALGFGFIEVGTVTPLAQGGNPKPRMFRLTQANALINRLGFNNHGLQAFIANVQRARSFRAAGGIVGLNIGKNAATPIERAVDDYLLGLEGVFPHADYITVNISSPNTKNLRELQGDAALDGLLGSLQRRRAELQARHARQVPMFVKIAPDLDAAQVQAIADALQRHRIDGVIASNTTLAQERGRRPGPCRRSGRPVRCAAAAAEQPGHRLAARRAGQRLSDHRRRRGLRRCRRAQQDRSRRRPGAALHRLDLQGPGLGHRSGCGAEGHAPLSAQRSAFKAISRPMKIGWCSM